MQSCIMATDMGRHADDLKNINSLIGENGIEDGEGLDKLLQDKEKTE